MISPPGTRAEHVGGKQHQLAVGEDDLAVLGDDAETVAVAVEGQADLGVGILQRADHVLQVLGLGRVGVVVGEGAVDLAEQFDQVTAHLAEQGGAMPPATPLPQSMTIFIGRVSFTSPTIFAM
jgi:hypothetical protein